jgi:fido (protein-threonine AMPylation protein)
VGARPAAEVQSLRELLTDFAADGWGPDRAEEAYDVMRSKESLLSGAYTAVAERAAEAVPRLGLPVVCQACLTLAHQTLYLDLLTNAGEPRRPSDAGGSGVHFGGTRGARREPRFSGTPAAGIDAELGAAFARLQDCRGQRADEAPDRAVLFYADLSLIHPFYDGNGRAGRFVVSVYLHLHGWLVEWGRIEAREGEFLRRINNVNEKATAATDYEEMLLRYWRRYVVRTDALR